MGGNSFVLFLQYSSLTPLYSDMWRTILGFIGGYNTDWCFPNLALMLFQLNLDQCSNIISLSSVFSWYIYQSIHSWLHSYWKNESFIMTNGCQFLFFGEINYNYRINKSYFNTLGRFFLLQKRHFIVSLISIPKFWET